MESFSLSYVQELNEKHAKKYVCKFFYPLDSGNHAVFIRGKFQILTTQMIKDTYFNRMSKEIKDWYFKTYNNIRSITYELNKPLLFDDKLNLCPKMKQSHTPYSDFSDNIKELVNVMLTYMFEILCKKNDDAFNFLKKWIANMLKGNKNNSAVYLKAREQGVGKSTLWCFIRDYVIGKDLSLETGGHTLKSNFNGILAGKLMVVFEELEVFSVNEWMAISSKLKRYITSNTITIENKGVDSFDSANINNYVIISNNDAIKDDDGRRYFILDIDTTQKESPRWETIYNKCFNDEVGKAFFSYMIEINTENFDSQSYPITQNKLDSYAKRLDNQEQFIKDEYILKCKSLNGTLSDIYENYKIYCLEKKLSQKNKIDFNKRLLELGLESYKSKGMIKYNISLEKLNEIAKTRHWMHEVDEYKNDVVEKESDGLDYEGLDYGLDHEGLDYKKLYNDMLLKYKELQGLYEKSQSKDEIKSPEILEKQSLVKPIRIKKKQAVDTNKNENEINEDIQDLIDTIEIF